MSAAGIVLCRVRARSLGKIEYQKSRGSLAEFVRAHCLIPRIVKFIIPARAHARRRCAADLFFLAGPVPSGTLPAFYHRRPDSRVVTPSDASNTKRTAASSAAGARARDSNLFIALACRQSGLLIGGTDLSTSSPCQDDAARSR